MRVIALSIAAVVLVGLFVTNYVGWAFIAELLFVLNKQSRGQLFGRGDFVVTVCMLIANYTGQASSLFGLLSMVLIALRVRTGLSVGYFAALCRGTTMLATLLLWFSAHEIASSLELLKPQLIPTFFVASLAAQGVTLLLMTWSLHEAKALLNDLEDRRQASISPSRWGDGDR